MTSSRQAGAAGGRNIIARERLTVFVAHERWALATFAAQPLRIDSLDIRSNCGLSGVREPARAVSPSMNATSVCRRSGPGARVASIIRIGGDSSGRGCHSFRRRIPLAMLAVRRANRQNEANQVPATWIGAVEIRRSAAHGF